MNRSLKQNLRCIINGDFKKYAEWSTDLKLFPLAYNSQITTTLGISPNEMVLNQKPRKPKLFTASSSKNAKGFCQPNKDSFYYSLLLHNHDEDSFHHPQILTLASGTHTKWILYPDKNITTFIKKSLKNFNKDKMFNLKKIHILHLHQTYN